jgi:FkbM family methyltransferase
VSGVFLHQQAVAGEEGAQPLFIGSHSGWHSLMQDLRGASETSIDVPTTDLEGLVTTAGGRIDFLKIDCEGAEWPLLEGKEGLLRDHVGYVAMEYHELPGKLRADLVSLFERAGFACRAEMPNAWSCGMLYAERRV